MYDTYFLAKAVKKFFDERIEFNIHDIMNMFPARAMSAENQQSFFALLNIAPTDNYHDAGAGVAVQVCRH